MSVTTTDGYVRTAFNLHEHARREMFEKLAAMKAAEEEYKRAHERMDEVKQVLAAAVAAALPGVPLAEKQYVLVCGRLFCINSYPHHKDGGRTMYAIEPRTAHAVG